MGCTSRRTLGLLTTLAVLFVGGCRDASAPVEPSAPTPAIGASFGYSSAASPDLLAWQQREQDRVAATRAASSAVYDSLHGEWERTRPSRQGLLRAVTSLVFGSLLYCEPLPYAADVKIIGPAGGELVIGPHKLTIPPGALTDFVVVTGESPVSPRVGVDFSPHGLSFAQRPVLKLDYKHCNRPITSIERVAYVDDGLNILEWPISVDNSLTSVVTAWLKHFSGYNVAAD